MSFYGQVVYEFTKVFSKLMITQVNNSELPVALENKNVFFEASDMWEQIDIKPLNRWIQVQGQNDNDATKTISIGHGFAGAQDPNKTTISLSSLTEKPIAYYYFETKDTVYNNNKNYYVKNEDDYVLFDGTEFEVDIIYYERIDTNQLKNGEVLKIAVSNYDQAGHFINANENQLNPSYIYYTMPTPTINIDNQSDISVIDSDDKLHFNGDNYWIKLNEENNALKFNHEIPVPDVDGQFPSEVVATILPTFERMHPAINTDILASSQEFLNAMAEDKIPQAEIDAMTEYLSDKEVGTIHKLKSGDLIKAYTITKDKNGHIILDEPTYYKLPVSATDALFGDQANNINGLINCLRDGTMTNELVTPSITYTHFQNMSNKVDFIGNKYDLYTQYFGNSVDLNKTLTQTIGRIDDATTGYMPKIAKLEGINWTFHDNESYSIAKAIGILADKLDDGLGNLKNTNTLLISLANSVENLRKDVEELQQQQ